MREGIEARGKEKEREGEKDRNSSRSAERMRDISGGLSRPPHSLRPESDHRIYAQESHTNTLLRSGLSTAPRSRSLAAFLQDSLGKLRDEILRNDVCAKSQSMFTPV